MTRCDKQYWNEFAKTIEIRSKRKKCFSADILSEQMKKFEQEWDFPLPESYKTFMEAFGPVSVAGSYQIMHPAGGKPDSDMASYNKSTRGFLENNLSEVRKCRKWYPQLMRVVTFGSDYCGDTYAWDPLEVTDHSACEYGVYYVIRESERWPPKKIADTFHEFIELFLLGGGLSTLDSDLEPLERFFTYA